MTVTRSDAEVALIARTVAHETRIRLLRWAAEHEQPFTTKGVANEWGVGLEALSYHVREVRDAGMLDQVKVTMGRGAVQRHYLISARGRHVLAILEELAA